MQITIFKNGKGILHGADPRRIKGAHAGVLRIGTAQIEVPAEGEAVMPMLFYGCTGAYDAVFVTSTGKVYDLGKVTLKGGWTESPSAEAVEIAELRYRTDEAEERLAVLEALFDTNALNFIIR